MAYIGETPIKKYVRIHYWQTVRRAMGDAFYTGSHIFLASEHAGDANTLLALGVPAENIVAVDRDARACTKARKLFPSIRVEEGDIVDVLSCWKSLDPASIYLDFCSELCKANIQTLARVMHLCPWTSLIGVNLLKGREKRKMSDKVRRTVSSSVGFRNGKTVFGDRGSSVERKCLSTEARHALLMTEAARAHFAEFGTVLVRHPHLLSTITYRTKSPMAVGIYEMRAEPWRGEVRRDWPGYRRGEVAYQLHSPRFLGNEIYTRSFSMEDVRRDCLSGTVRQAQILNVSERTVTAWRAHETRGSYAAP